MVSSRSSVSPQSRHLTFHFQLLIFTQSTLETSLGDCRLLERDITSFLFTLSSTAPPPHQSWGGWRRPKTAQPASSWSPPGCPRWHSSSQQLYSGPCTGPRTAWRLPTDTIRSTKLLLPKEQKLHFHLQCECSLRDILTSSFWARLLLSCSRGKPRLLSSASERRSK